MEMSVTHTSPINATPVASTTIQAKAMTAVQTTPCCKTVTLVNGEIRDANSTCLIVCGRAIPLAEHSRAIIVSPPGHALAPPLDALAVLRTFDAKLLLCLRVDVAGRSWTSQHRAICAVPTRLTHTAAHFANSMPAAIIQASGRRESPNTLCHDGIEIGEELFVCTIGSAKRADGDEIQTACCVSNADSVDRSGHYLLCGEYATEAITVAQLPHSLHEVVLRHTRIIVLKPLGLLEASSVHVALVICDL